MEATPGPEQMTASRIPISAHAGLLGAVAAIAAALALWPSLVSLYAAWREIYDYQHGPLIALLSVAWIALVAFRSDAPAARPSLAGSALLAVVLLMWLVAYGANSLMAHQLLYPAAIWAAVFAAVGWLASRRFIAPVAFLYFATPVWDHFLPALQWLSVTATEALLAVLGVPAEVHEYSVTIPAGTFQIIEGCSGKRYFMVTLAVAVLAGARRQLKPQGFAAFFALAGALALVANWVRIVIVIYAGHVTDMQHYFVAVEHTTLGNVIFVLLLSLVLLLVRYFEPVRQAVRSGQPADESEGSIPHPPWRAGIPLVLLILAFALTQARAGRGAPVAALAGLPLATGKWQGPLPSDPGWAPRYVSPDGEYRAAYHGNTGSVEVYAAVYGEQRQGRELVAYGNSLLAPGSWRRPWPPTTGTISGGQTPLATIEAYAPDGSQWLVAYTFEIGGRTTTSEYAAQLLYGVKSFLGAQPAGVIALAGRCNNNCEGARSLIASFWEDMSSAMLAVVPDKEPDR